MRQHLIGLHGPPYPGLSTPYNTTHARPDAVPHARQQQHRLKANSHPNILLWDIQQKTPYRHPFHLQKRTAMIETLNIPHRHIHPHGHAMGIAQQHYRTQPFSEKDKTHPRGITCHSFACSLGKILPHILNWVGCLPDTLAHKSCCALGS